MKSFFSFKSLTLILFLVFFIIIFYNCFLYISVTHLSADELEWVTNLKEGENMYFKSKDGTFEAARITGITVSNSSSKINWNYMKTGKKEYKARAEVRYELGYDRNEESFRIWKGNNQKPVTFSSNLGGGLVWRVPPDTTTLKVDGKTLNDVMFFDNENHKGIFHDGNIKIRNYYWSKKYGLVQYTLKDGTVFSRIDLNLPHRRSTSDL